MTFIMVLNKLIPKYKWKNKGPRISKTFLKKKCEENQHDQIIKLTIKYTG